MDRYKKIKRESFSREPVIRPLLETFIKHTWWTVLEATFVLTGWPEYEHSWANIGPAGIIPSDICEDRPVFFLPSYELDLKKYTKEFQKIFNALNHDIDNQLLSGRHCLIDRGVYNLVSPFDSILWALTKGCSLPVDLQEALSIKQRKQKQSKPWQKKVKVMIVGQYYKLSSPRAKKEDVINSEWMRKYVCKIEHKNQSRQIRKDYSIISENGRSGRPKKEDNIPDLTDLVSLKPIPQVLLRGKKFECDFDLLETTISTAVWIKSTELIGLEQIRHMNLPEYLEIMERDDVIRLYFADSPQIIGLFIQRVIKKVFYQIADIFYWQSISQMGENGVIKLNSLERNSI